VTVRYVDRISWEQSVRFHPELDPGSIVRPDFVADGFRLETIAAGSQDFVIANHVLEHGPNPIGTLLAWAGVLRAGGVLYVTVPVLDHTFDRGRPLTTLEHMQEDLRLADAGDRAALAARDRDHYLEWVTRSVPAIEREQGKTPPERSEREAKAEADRRQAEGEEIHFHTFTRRSFEGLLRAVAERHDRSLRVLEVVDLGFEAIGVVRKRGPSGA
jgi:SAM-dependent methyltransferase